MNRLRRLLAMVEAADPAEAEVRWLADVSGRDNFLAHLGGDSLRDVFDR